MSLYVSTIFIRRAQGFVGGESSRILLVADVDGIGLKCGDGAFEAMKGQSNAYGGTTTVFFGGLDRFLQWWKERSVVADREVIL